MNKIWRRSKNEKSPLTVRTAALLALSISLLLNFLFFVIFVYGREAVMHPDKENVRTGFQINIMLVNLTNNFLFAFFLYLFCFKSLESRMNIRRDNERLKCRQQSWFIFLMTICIASLLSYCFSLIQIQFFEHVKYPERIIRGGLLRDYFVALIVVLSSHLIYLTYKHQQTAIENKTLMTENLKTRLMALKNQVDPHFLFNSLNTLNSLIKIDAYKAQEYVQQLSFVFRYTLQNKDIITVEEELKFTRAYCHLMQIRYGDGLQFTINVDEQLYPCLIVPLSLQTLVENAIKHNVVSARHPLTIAIETADDNNYIYVVNPIHPKKEAETGERIGLNNLFERYRLMWQKEIIISEDGLTFGVKIPLIKPTEFEIINRN